MIKMSFGSDVILCMSAVPLDGGQQDKIEVMDSTGDVMPPVYQIGGSIFYKNPINTNGRIEYVYQYVEFDEYLDRLRANSDVPEALIYYLSNHFKRIYANAYITADNMQFLKASTELMRKDAEVKMEIRDILREISEVV